MTEQHTKNEISDARFGSAILQALQQPVLVCGANDKIVWANYAAESFFCVSRQILSGCKLIDLFPFGSPVLQLVHTVRQRNAPMREYRLSFSPLRTKKEQQTDVFASPIAEVSGAVSLLFQERTIADKIDRQLVSRGAARSAIGLATMLAHEIKNPLAGIRGAAQLLEQTIPEEDHQLAQLIQDETDRIVKLVDRVEIFGDERPIERAPVNIHVVLHRVKLLMENAQASGVEFSEEYDPSLPLVFGNEDQLIQVFLNLIKNAAEAIQGSKNPRIGLATAFQPGIKIGASGTNDRISLPLEITIKDSGSGIPEDIRPFMFDPFVTGKQNGSGLGLALVAKIISDHGGTIECDSHADNTTFRVLLPMAPSKHQQGKS